MHIATDEKTIARKLILFEDWHTDAMARIRKRAYEHVQDGSWMTMKEAVKK